MKKTILLITALNLNFFSPLVWSGVGGVALSQTNLTKVKSWAYQLQNISVSQINTDTSFKLIVMDYSEDGTDDTKFTASQIASVKTSGKYAIAYISIGEAEDYRYYWNPVWTTTPPAFLGPENPDWVGNYKVKFWDAQWRNIIFSWIDTIIGQGFDGIYLDIIDAYYYWQVENPQEPKADSLMCEFVVAIRNHVNTVTGNNNFIIIPQNGEEVINGSNVSASLKTNYLNAVNGVGAEDVFFPGNLDEDNPYKPDTFRINQLKEYLTNQKQVFSIDYLTKPNYIQQYTNAAGSENFVPYVCVRNLDQLCPGIILTSVNELQIADYPAMAGQIAPNPFSNTIVVRITNPALRRDEFTNEKLELRIYNVLGREVKQLIINNQSTIINLQGLPAGIYFLKINTVVNSFSKKIIKFE